MDYVLENEDLKVIISSHGAELQSVYDKKAQKEYLWQGDATIWGRRAPVLFPIVGRLKEGKYKYQDTEYMMPGHGFARDLEFHELLHDTTEICFELHDSEQTKEMYPFAFVLRIFYQLKGREIAVRYEVFNPDSEETLWFSIGGHPAFQVPMTDEGEFIDTHFFLGTDEPVTQRFIQGVLLTKEKEEQPKLESAIHRKDFEQDAWIYETKNSVTAILKSPYSTIRLSYQNAPYLGVWSPADKKAPFVCLEPWWGITDTEEASQLWPDKLGLHSLLPRQKWDTSYQLIFGEK